MKDNSNSKANAWNLNSKAQSLHVKQVEIVEVLCPASDKLMMIIMNQTNSTAYI